jgi:ribosomal-protein-serine acetyltransferase
MSIEAPTFAITTSTRLRPANVSDAAALFRVVDANRDHLRQWLPWLDYNRSEADSLSFLKGVVERSRADGGTVWMIEHDGQIAGVAGFNWIAPGNRIGEIGYWLAASHQGRGIMTGCVARLVRHAFEDLNLNRITIPAAVENHRSRAIPERLGFQAEGVLREAEWLYDHFVDHVLYAQIRSDWDKANRREE